ncbi:hypothetical protein H0H81_000426, partial [Sphagnurus paluster]
IKRAVSSWLHKFADAAVRALDTEYQHRGLREDAQKAGLVLKLIGDHAASAISSKTRPFL